jgi:hypothetical protein
MNQNAGNAELSELIEWALPIQQRHLRDVLEGAKTLAAEEDPQGTA